MRILINKKFKFALAKKENQFFFTCKCSCVKS